MLALAAQVATGCYFIATTKDVDCMIQSVNGGFMFTLLSGEATLLGSILGLLWCGYRLY